MEKQAPPLQTEHRTHYRPSYHQRASHISFSLLKRLAAIGVLFGAIGEMSQTVPTHSERPPAVRAQSIEDLLSSIRSAIGNTIVEEHSAPPEDIDLPPDPGIAPLAMGKAALSKTWSWGKRLWSKPSKTVEETQERLRASVTYLNGYRMGADQVVHSDPAKIDCNDHANITCEQLDRIGLPMYLVSLWPEDPEKRFDEGWHQIAACKIREQCFLLFDQSHTILWHGSLDSYALRHGPNVRMRVIPHVGISDFAEPKHDHFLPKFLVQAERGVNGEDAMKSLDLFSRREIMQVAGTGTAHSPFRGPFPH